MSDEAVSRGPNYDWQHEAAHYRVECDKLRDLLRQVERSGEETQLKLEQTQKVYEQKYSEVLKLNAAAATNALDLINERNALQAKLVTAHGLLREAETGFARGYTDDGMDLWRRISDTLRGERSTDTSKSAPCLCCSFYTNKGKVCEDGCGCSVTQAETGSKDA
jgi:hypothetical protein